jgi:hypothetical protein
MNDRETRHFDMFGRVQTFGKDNATDFAAGSKAARNRENIPAGGTMPPNLNP